MTLLFADRPDDARRLREALAAAMFTTHGVEDVLGATAMGLLLRDERAPAVRRTLGGSPLETLIRLFMCGASVERVAAQRALAPLNLDACAASEILCSTARRCGRRSVCGPSPTMTATGLSPPTPRNGTTTWWVSVPLRSPWPGSPSRPGHTMSRPRCRLGDTSAVRTPARDPGCRDGSQSPGRCVRRVHDATQRRGQRRGA